MTSYATLMEMELPPTLYMDPSDLSSSTMTPFSQQQAKSLGAVSDNQKKDWEFTVSVDSSLSDDMLRALDDDLSNSNNTAFSQIYHEYCADVRKAYDKQLYNCNDKRDKSKNTYRKAVVDRFAFAIVDCVRDTILRLIPDCSPFHETVKSFSIVPNLVIIPDYTLFFRDHSLNAPPGQCHALLGEDKGPLLLFPVAKELIERIEAVGSLELDYPYNVSFSDDWWTLINKAALYMTQVDSCGADTLLYYSLNSFIVIRRQRNGSEPDHLFLELRGNFRNGSLEQQFHSVGNAGLQRAGRLFPRPDGGYQPFVHLHDMFLASSIITALASNSDYAVNFPSLERFRNERRPQPPAKESNIYNVHGREHDMPLDSSLSSESDDSILGRTYYPSQDPYAAISSLSSRNKALSHAIRIFNELHGCGSVPMTVNFYWSVRMPRMTSSCVSLVSALHGQDIDIESSLGSSSDGDTYLASVRGSNKKLVLKVFSFAAFGQADFCAYMAMKDLQGSIIPPPPPVMGKVMHAVKVLHQLGYRHGDLPDNIVWTVDEDPVIVDLMRVRTHHCLGDSCSEIEAMRQCLGLTRRDADLWSLVIRPYREQEPGMFVTGKPHSPKLGTEA
ncbi:hypothetical protein EDD85DRAFT_978147 [Armillaria nabsnona]|nr:hypothetical protein EDD85DRAFT_978147 [Armillaria nabsnona]